MEGVGGAESIDFIAERQMFLIEAEGETPANGSNDLFYFFNKLGKAAVID